MLDELEAFQILLYKLAGITIHPKLPLNISGVEDGVLVEPGVVPLPESVVPNTVADQSDDMPLPFIAATLYAYVVPATRPVSTNEAAVELATLVPFLNIANVIPVLLELLAFIFHERLMELDDVPEATRFIGAVGGVEVVVVVPD